MEPAELRVLIVEEQDDDLRQLVHELGKAGTRLHWQRVADEAALAAALAEGVWDLVISDYALPELHALRALELVKESHLDLPFIVVSSRIGEDIAVLAMKAGAHDFIVKGQWKRLLPAIERERREARERGERRVTEAALRRSEERFRKLIASMDDVVFTMDCTLHFDEVFGEETPVRELSRAHLAGRTPREVFGADGLVHERAALRALAGERVVYEWSVAAADELRCFQTAMSAIVDVDGRPSGVVGVSRDISEQKRVHEQLLISDRMASVGTLAAGVAHEINNPLAVVLTNLDYVTRQLPELERRAACSQTFFDAISDARECADRAGRIVQDLKVFSRSPDDEPRHAVDLHQVLETSARMARSVVRRRGHLVLVHGDVPPVWACEARLGQVFLNLIVNAAQSIPDGHANDHEVRLVTHVPEDNDDVVAVEVRDTGLGMAPAVLRKLFTPFFTTKPVGEGTGLGLSICHRIVTSFGGRIEVESQVGKGSVFRVLLPAAPDAARAGADHGGSSDPDPKAISTASWYP